MKHTTAVALLEIGLVLGETCDFGGGGSSRPNMYKYI